MPKWAWNESEQAKDTHTALWEDMLFVVLWGLGQGRDCIFENKKETLVQGITSDYH